MTEPWASVEDVAQHLGVAKDSIYRWIDHRGLPPTRSAACGSSSSPRSTFGSVPVASTLPTMKREVPGDSAVDRLDRLLKLRLVVARFGEMDLAKWWNTKGQLGKLGTAALRRGFPRTHYFAQARSSWPSRPSMYGGVRAPGCVTLWRLPEATEEEFDARWEQWLDNASDGHGSSRSWRRSRAPTSCLLFVPSSS